MDVFPTADQARAGSRNNIKIFNEIRAIEAEILTAIAAGNLAVTVSDSPMTNLTLEGGEALIYGAVFLSTGDPDPNSSDYRSRAEQMDLVQKNFSDLGYTIVRLQNGTNLSFVWSIQW